MATKMLIDSTHAEETRVAVVNNELLEEFDYFHPTCYGPPSQSPCSRTSLRSTKASLRVNEVTTGP